MTAYKIGQLIYVVLHDKNMVYPMQVTEIINKQTLEGDTVTYMVAGGVGTDASSMRIDQINGEIFTTAKAVKEMLFERASSGIDQLITNAMTKAKEWYPTAFEAGTMAAGTAAVKALEHKSMHAPGQQIKARTPKRAPEAGTLGDELQQDSDDLTVQLDDGTTARVKLPATM